MDRFPNIAEALAFLLDVWIFGQRRDVWGAWRPHDRYDPSIDLELYRSVFGLE